MKAIVFPGQGSQIRGMGKDLFDVVPEYNRIEGDVDALVGYSMRTQCIEDPGSRLGSTAITQPAMFVVNALHFLKLNREQRSPAFFAGHSLGEYNALYAAGVFDFLTGLRIVVKRGELMTQLSEGGMAAVVGLNSTQVCKVVRDFGFDALDVANFNAPKQTVVAGPTNEISRAAAAFERAGASMYVQLPVSAAFHSRYVANVAKEFDEFLATVPLQSPKIPVISNVTARPYPVFDPQTAVRSLLVRQLSRPVEWLNSIRFLLAQGVDEIVETGPGTVLTRLLQQIRAEAA